MQCLLQRSHLRNRLLTMFMASIYLRKKPSPGAILFLDETLLLRLEYWEMIVEEMKIWFHDKRTW